MNTLLSGTRFANYPTLRYKEIENHADGNCLFESLLDSAHAWLPSDHILRSRYSSRGSTRRPLENAIRLRAVLAEFANTKESSRKRSLSILKKNYAWATDHEIQIIADCFNLCIILHAQPDQTWSAFVPFGTEINNCIDVVVLRNKGRRQSLGTGIAGVHYVALIPTGSSSSSNTNRTASNVAKVSTSKLKTNAQKLKSRLPRGILKTSKKTLVATSDSEIKFYQIERKKLIGKFKSEKELLAELKRRWNAKNK